MRHRVFFTRSCGAVEASLGSAERDAAHRAAARVLHGDGAPPGQVPPIKVRPAGDGWVLARLREAARAALNSGAPQGAAELLARALAEPPPEQRVALLRETARACERTPEDESQSVHPVALTRLGQNGRA